MLQNLLLLLSACLAATSTTDQRDFDVISFTQPLYHGVVQEKAVSSVVSSNVMMGMWLNAATRDVQFEIEGATRGFEASKRILGNFVFLNLRTTSVNRAQDVRVRAISRAFNQETFCTVRVSVIDVNDFQPLFPPVPYSFSIDEDSKVGTVITYVKATDSDRDPENTRLYYGLAQFTSDNFAVDPTSGAVILTAPLKAKNQASHSVVIKATDRKAALAGMAKSKTTTLTVSVNTVNAHSPEIVVRGPLSFDTSDSESFNKQRRVYAIIQVYDADTGTDGKTSMPIVVNCSIPGLFTVEHRRSENEYHLIFTTAPPQINGFVNVTLEVSDQGSPPRISRKVVNIELFDRRLLIPVFLNDTFTMVVNEISPVATHVGFVAAEVLSSDQSNNIRYSITNGNHDGKFSINANTSLITTSEKLNRTEKSQYLLTVAAVNIDTLDNYDQAKNTTTVTILVEDANNHDPIFTEDIYTSSISENAPVGTVLTRVQATDDDAGRNGSVLYRLIDASGLPFAIDTFNGTIYTTGLLDSDILTTSTFKLRVRASDSGLPFNRKSECFVKVRIVNTNDNPPVFNEVDCAVSVPISMRKGSKVLQLDSIDIDLNPVSCALLSGGDGWFEMESATCELRLAADLTNTDPERRFTLFVTATDGKYTSEPVSVNVSVVQGEDEIVKSCRDTGAIRRFEDSIKSLQPASSHSGEKSVSSQSNRTSQLPNNHKPTLVPNSSLMIVNVSEDAKLNTVVARVRAIDRDSGYNGKLWFTIVAGNIDSCFVINTQNGFIYLARSLDRERRSSYRIKVKVSDLGTPPRSIVARLKFMVTDVNDNSPVFTQTSYAFELPENVTVGYVIQEKIHATDSDEGDNARVRYSLLSDSYGDKSFFINPLTGYINVTKELDRERIPQYNLTVIASDSSRINPRRSATRVVIRLLDINDNAPRFHQSIYRIRISEDLPEHAVLFWLQAHDQDEGENSVVRYTLTDGVTNKNDAKTRFDVDGRTGAIRLKAPLDARVQNRYNITARARDSKKLYSTCYIEVEVLPVNRNLYAPYFPYRDTKIQVAENAAIGSEVGVVSARDDDTTEPERDIAYFIVDGTGLGFFAIDENSGAITTLKTLDRETEQYYWLTVVAEDRATVPLSSHMFVLVEVTDINDNAPQPLEPIYFSNVKENSPDGSAVTQVKAFDLDAGSGANLTYSMGPNKYFSIDRNTGVITTSVTKRRLDRESMDVTQLSFDVHISDKGFPQLTSLVRVVVNVTDVNDNPPVFYESLRTRYYLPERNRTKKPTRIARVVAHDEDAGRNGDIDYVLAHSRKFTINSKTGVISTTRSFKAGQKSVLKVSAFDLANNQKQAKIRLEIYWIPVSKPSRFGPTFTEGDNDLQEGCYFEHVDTGFVVDDFMGRNVRLLQAEDIDSDRLWFRIAGGNEANMFDINADNVLFVSGEPDAETMDFYNLTIEVTDGHNTATKQIGVSICDVNDHRPRFAKKLFQASVDENMPPNSRVVRLAVTDGDRSRKNRNFIFKIRGSVDPDSTAKFRITSDGTIYTTVQLNREVQREHVLFVEVDDQGVPGALQGFTQVVITVLDRNEHAPQFTSPSYTAQFFTDGSDPLVGVDETIDRVALRVRATDSDVGENARIFYSILPGEHERFWKIDPSSGEISATELLKSVDVERVRRLTLVVKAMDGGRPSLSSTCNVTIDLKRSSSAPPRFETDKLVANVPESAAIGSFVTVLTATALSSVTYSLTAGNEAQHFSINPHSGVISLLARLDREKVPNYQLRVTCVTTDGANATASVRINVMDVNDNRPRFLSSSYLGYVSESTGLSPSGPITDATNRPLVISASDLDLGNNAQIKYDILDPPSDVARRFSIDANTGAIRTRAGVDLFNYETKEKYQFKVGCRDMGSPQLFSDKAALVIVYVRDANDTVPAFDQSDYNFELLLPTADGMVVSKDVHAARAGSRNRPKLLTYSISGGNTQATFKIDPESGMLFVANATTLSNGDTFSLRLRVSDGKRSAGAVAHITVSSMNGREKLAFTKDVYEVSMKENSTEVLDLLVPRVVGSQLKDNVRFSILNPNPSFRIESTSGLIQTTGVPVDREEKSVYELLVQAINVDDPLESDENDLPRGRCMVKVHVTDINDNPPRFVKLLYHAVVQMDAEPLTVVKQVRAVDRDVGVNGEVRYGLTGPNATLFNVDARDGVITLRRVPSVSDGGNVKFNVTVVARNIGATPLEGRVVMVVSVVNRATPVFTQPYYDGITVSEDARPHIVVTDAVKASSPDGSDVVYTIEEGDPLQQFDIDFNIGTITTRRTLDHEIDSRYRLRIRARDAQSRAYADAEVEITVVDVNDNSPIFSQILYQRTLLETAGVGTTVVEVKASDKDSFANGKLSYQIVDDLSPNGGYFHIDQDSGVVWTARDLDHEMEPILTFVVRASDRGAPMRHADVMVIVTVKDINDNPPVFEKASYRYEVSSATDPGQFLGVVSAWDPDSSNTSTLTYSIQNSGSPSLAINSSTGVVTLVKKGISPLTTNVTVSDGVFASTTEFIVSFASDDASTPPCAFKKTLYKFSIAENELPGTKVGKISAFGVGSLIFQIETDSNSADLFRINADSGKLRTAREIDREAVQEELREKTISTVIDFHVIAIDARGSIARCLVQVKILDRNDNAPVFTQSKYSAVVDPSNQNKDSVVNVTAYDADADANGRITYSLYDAPVTVKKHFLLDYSTGEITVRNPNLPFGDIDELRFFVRATDNGEDEKSNVVSVTIYLVSNQDSLPRFSETLISATLPENAPVGNKVATVHASTSNNRRITYELAEPYISNADDKVLTSGTRNNSATAHPTKFRIDPVSGLITTASVLDREEHASHVIDVLAYVETTPRLFASTQILLSVTDVNDNAPVFISSIYHASIVENSPSPSQVVVVEARDPDEGRFGEITYSLVAPKGIYLPFVIDPHTGLISASESLDRENHTSYELVVTATDNDEAENHASSCRVIVEVVDINDSPPTFSQTVYKISVSESTSVGMTIPNLMRITDSDRDGLSPVRLYIIGGDRDQNFELVLDELSSNNIAAVGLKILKNLDRERTPDYTLTILATDGLHSNTTELRIEVEDVNDNTPVCEQLRYYTSVSERVSLEHPIINIRATDADAGENGKIRFELSGEGFLDFRIDPLTGEILTAVQLDRETTSQYTLTASATDGGGKSCRAEVLISVEDVNDEKPTFDARSLKGATKENAPVNSLIHRVSADDGDRGMNGTLVFSLADTINGQFYMEPKSGVVVLKKPLDRETVSSYQLQIIARDNGNKKRLSTAAVLYLEILDINDNPPLFDHDQYEAVVREDAPIGHVISRVSAESLDVGANAEMHYDITRGNERGKFEINQASGQVRLISKLDYESDQSYVLKISAADHSADPLTSDCTLRINVTDVNDNVPQFALPVYKITLPEDSPLGHVVTTVSASDRDSGPGGEVSYQLKAAKGSPFAIDSSSGSLQVVEPGLDFEKQNFHRIAVVVVDHGDPALSSQAFVDVFVTDVNDNRPRFLVQSPLGNESGDVSCSLDGANCTIYVREGSTDPVVKGIALLNATDADSELNGAPFKFQLVEGDPKGLFYLDGGDILKSRSPFELDQNSLIDGAEESQVHLVRIAAEDSGEPSLSAQPELTLRIVVLKENLYPPVITPHHVEITTAEGQFPGGLITRSLHATDRDAFDQTRIRFALANSEDFEQFVIDPMTGALSTHTPLPVGSRNVTVRVSDGSHSSFSSVAVVVSQIKQKVLKDSVSIAFSEISSLKDYLASYHDVFVRKLENAMPNNFNAKRDLVVISLQRRDDNIELLFGIRMPPDTINREFYSSKSLRGFLENSRGLLKEDGIGLDVEWIDGTACLDKSCVGTCHQNPLLLPFNSGVESSAPVSTNVYSLVTPTFIRKKTCVCPRGTVGKNCESVCTPANNPCPKNHICLVVEQESLGYRCENPTPNNTVMAFSGRAYAQFAIDGARRSGQFRVGLRLRTFQSNAIVFHADGPTHHFSRLETVEGLLRYTFDCGSGPQEMMQTLTPVGDGQWHEVHIESRHDEKSKPLGFKLIIDENFVASAKVLGTEPRINLSRITFGGIPSSRKAKRSTRITPGKRHANRNHVVKQGFHGCLRSVNVNNAPVTLQPKTGFRMSKMLDVAEKCDTAFIDMGACKNSPCLNGGRCLPLSDGSHECQCPLTFDGLRCEIPDLCGSLPCRNQGYCLSDGQDIQCHCGSSFIGDRCEIAVCPGIGSCLNGGICKNDPSGLSSCQCQPGWSGVVCNVNINECEKRCGSEKFCEVVDGKYVCNCSASEASEDSTCKSLNHVDEPSVSSTSPLYFIIFGVVALLILVVVIVFWIRCVKQRKKKEDRPNDSTSDPFIPHRIPPIPERPADYQRSSRDSFTFDDQRDRQVVYVPPLAQNAPPASDNDSIRKPSPSWPEYDSAAYYDKSAPSSVHHLSDSRKTSSQSNAEQQIRLKYHALNGDYYPMPGFHWDDTDLNTESMASPAPSHGQYVQTERSRSNFPPGSPGSYNSVNTASTRRSHRSHKSGALSGHYNSGRRRAEKQLIQMLKMDKDIREKEGIELEVREILSKALKAQNAKRCESTNSSLRSLPSSQQSAFQHFSKTDSPYPSTTHCGSFTPESSDLSDLESNPYEAQEPLLKINPRQGYPSRNQNAPPSIPRSSEADLPLPPSEYELQTLHDEDSESLRAARLPPATSNKSYSSLLDSSFQVELPTPKAARKRPFHPNQYLLDHARNISDMSLATEFTPGSSYNINGQKFDPRDPYYGRMASYETPRPPQRRDSERLAMSSLSEEDDDSSACPNLSRSKARHSRPPVHPNTKLKRLQKSAATPILNQSSGAYTPRVPPKSLSSQLYNNPNAMDV